MADVTIAGKEITFDLARITRKEYREMFDGSEEADSIFAKVAGITPQDVENMSALDFKIAFNAFLRKCREPLLNPT